jgi:hypothetical protein
MIQKIRLFFATVFSHESLTVKATDSSRLRASFLSELLRAEKLPEYPPRAKKSGPGFLSGLLALEKLPAAKIHRQIDRSLASNLLEPEKNPSRIKP